LQPQNHNATQYNTLQQHFNSTATALQQHCNSTATHPKDSSESFRALQFQSHNVTHYNTLQHPVTTLQDTQKTAVNHFARCKHTATLQDTITSCNILQHPATHHNTTATPLQHHCNTTATPLQHTRKTATNHFARCDLRTTHENAFCIALYVRQRLEPLRD